MGYKHISELLIEANKNISKLIDAMQHESSSSSVKQNVINDVNSVIRQLDHVVEQLEKN